jgi:uncharacterized membrane protein
MRALRVALLCSLGAAALAGTASAAVLIAVVPVAGSTATNVFAIGDDGTIAGSYLDQDGAEHAFFGPLDGKHYTTFEGGDNGSQARGINGHGFVTGIANAQSGDPVVEPIFVRNPNGRVGAVTRDGAALTGIIAGIDNAKNRFVGGYWDQAKQRMVAFIGAKGKWTHDLKIAAAHKSSVARGINSAGIIVGGYTAPPSHGFVLSNKTLATVDYPGADATATELDAINDDGKAVGQWLDAAGHAHSFVYDTVSASFADITVKHAKQVQAWGINAAGAVAVVTDKGSYIWCANKRACISPQAASSGDR